jgi:16S rRNA (uracil1498-N3)-methyltransferase
MTRRRWIADEVDLRNNRAALLGQNAVHLARVLRAKVGQEFDLVLPGENAGVRTGRVIAVNEQRVEFELGEELDANSAHVQVALYLAVFKFDRMEWAIEKAVELGVARIVSVIARRTEKHLATAAEKRVERWRRIAHEAAQQSRRACAPEIAPPTKLPAALLAGFEGLRIVLAENENQATFKEVLRDLGDSPQLSLAIGPEGGWTKDELTLFAKSGWRSASLGTNILRAETAAIAALALVLCA